VTGRQYRGGGHTDPRTISRTGQPVTGDHEHPELVNPDAPPGRPHQQLTSTYSIRRNSAGQSSDHAQRLWLVRGQFAYPGWWTGRNITD
jgi:hypothetical protein